MNKDNRKLNILINILIVVVAVTIIGVLAQRYFFGSAAYPDGNASRTPSIGKKVDLADTNFSESPKTLILVLSSSCRFCTESMPFYRRLAEQTRGNKVRFIAVFPTDVEQSKRYLEEHSVGDFEVKKASISSLDVGGTPTLILTDGEGVVTNFWIGKLSAEREAEVSSQLDLE